MIRAHIDGGALCLVGRRVGDPRESTVADLPDGPNAICAGDCVGRIWNDGTVECDAHDEATRAECRLMPHTGTVRL